MVLIVSTRNAACEDCGGGASYAYRVFQSDYTHSKDIYSIKTIGLLEANLPATAVLYNITRWKAKPGIMVGKEAVSQSSALSA